MAAHLMELAHHWGEPCVAVHTGTLKKFATGSGRATKIEMMAATIQHRGRDIGEIGEHEADAILVALWAAETHR
jgi:Holliday junction resolvasome RuvABC endonuclease subunit